MVGIWILVALGVIAIGLIAYTFLRRAPTAAPSVSPVRPTFEYLHDILKTGQVWKTQEGKGIPSVNIDLEIGTFSFVPPDVSRQVTYRAEGSNARLIIEQGEAIIEVDFVGGDASSIFFQGTIFESTHPEVRLNSNILRKIRMQIRGQVGFTIAPEDEVVKHREYARPVKSKPLVYGRPGDDDVPTPKKKKRPKRERE